MKHFGKNYVNLLAAFSDAMYSQDSFNLISIWLSEPQEKYPYDKLGGGFELRPIIMTTEDGKNVIENREKFCNLYHNDTKVSDTVFRKGGSGGTFKHGYCSLIHYTKKKDHETKIHGFSSGTHVIINEFGKTCLSGNGSLNYPNHIGGHIGSIGNYIYDLRTGIAIAPQSSTLMTGLNCAIIEHKYSWYDKEVKLPLGIYRIDFNTAEVTLIDQIK